jgi:hypothetical protein
LEAFCLSGCFFSSSSYDTSLFVFFRWLESFLSLEALLFGCVFVSLLYIYQIDCSLSLFSIYVLPSSVIVVFDTILSSYEHKIHILSSYEHKIHLLASVQSRH